MYVDLNPIRAGIADSLQSSDFTSIQERINSLDSPKRPLAISTPQTDSATNQAHILHKYLVQFDGAAHQNQQVGIPFHFADYLELIDWTGRAIRLDKKGYIDNQRPKLLHELGIAPDAWLTSAKEFRDRPSRRRR